MELRPHIARATARIQSVIAIPGGYIVLTDAGLEWFDLELRPGRVIRGDFGTPAPLADGRMVATASLDVIERDATITKIEGIEWCRFFVPTSTGFFAIGTEAVVVDHRGTRRLMPFPKTQIDRGAIAWRDGAVLAGDDGLTFLDGSGTQVARATEPLMSAPVAVGANIVAFHLDTLHVYDAVGALLSKTALLAGTPQPFGAGFVMKLPHVVAYYEFASHAPVEKWRRSVKNVKKVLVAGDRLVVGTDDRVEILDGKGKVRAQIEIPYVSEAHPFGDGLVLVGHEIQWWRPDAEPVALVHETLPRSMYPVPAGLASADHDVLYIWRTDEQGPVATTFEHDLPLDTRLVVGDEMVIIEGAGRFALRGRTVNGREVVVHPAGKRWRPLSTPDEAVAIIAKLLGRVFDGPIPTVPADGRVRDITPTLASLPLAETVNLYGRSMFAPGTLDPGVLDRIATARDRFFDELSLVLDVKKRSLVAAIRARKAQLEPPRTAHGYDYLGTFTTTGRLTIADPCYVDKKTVAGFVFAHKVDAHEGLWHVFVRGVTDKPELNAELAVVHEHAFDVHATKLLGTVSVDAGCAGVFDKACPKIDLDLPLEEGAVAGLGAVAHTAYGDGGYPAFTGSSGGKVAKIRIVFSDPKPELDRLVLTHVVGSGKPYSASTRFAVGDAIEHPKFGLGAVTRVGLDGKIDVRFADTTRTLIHAKK